MLCKDIIRMIEDTYPKCAALEWDNIGLLVGRTEKEVKKIYIALDATDDVIDDAVANGADMLLTHHPLIFEPLKQITDENFIGNRVVKLLQHDISYYAMHTNYDVLKMADLSANMLGLSGTEVLEVTDCGGGTEFEQGIGKVGMLPKQMTLEECCEFVKKTFGLESVKAYGNPKQSVHRVAISPGSGKGMSNLALEKNADVFITADISYHEAIDAVSKGIAIMDAGHYGLEHIYIEDMASYLRQILEAVDVATAEIKHPYFVI